MSVTTAKPTTAASDAPDYKDEQYDLTQIIQDRNDIQLRTTDFIDNVIIPIDRFARQAAPDTPYLAAASGNSANIKQFTHPIIAFILEKGVPSILGKGVTAQCPPDRNPTASTADLGTAARLVMRTWEKNDTFNPGRNTLHRRGILVARQGGYAALYEYPNADDKRVRKTGFGVHSTLFSLLDVQYERDGWGEIKRVIVAKRRVASELDPSLRGTHTGREELDVYEHWDRINHGIVLNGTEVVKPLTPHGYVDRSGNPICPWVIKLHNPDEFIKGDTNITSSGIAPVKTLVGHPAVEHLIQTAGHLSYGLTLLRFMATEAALPTKVIKGSYSYDQGRRVYLFDTAQPQDGVEMLNSAQNIGPTLQVIEAFQTMGQQGGMGDSLAMGNVKEGVSGTAADSMRDLVQGILDAIRDTVEEGMTEEGYMVFNLVASNATPSVNDRHIKATGKSLPLPAAMTMDQAAAHSTNFKSDPLPGSSAITGDPTRNVTALDIEGIDYLDVNIAPLDRIAVEQRWQFATQELTNQNSVFSPVEILGDMMGYDDAQGVYDRGLTHKLMSNPSLPFADLAGLRGLLQEKQGTADPAQIAALTEQINQAEMAAVTRIVQQKLQAISQAAVMPASAPPADQQQGQPPGPPPGVNPNAPPGAPPANVTPFPMTAQGAIQPNQAVGGMSPGMAPPPMPAQMGA